MAETSIEWTDRVWNCLRGCSRVSSGCMRCYAERIAARDLPGMRSPTTGEPFAVMSSDGPHWTGKVELIESKLSEPLRWRKPCRCFVNSMSDLFHESVPDETIDRIFAVMALCPQHTFQVLTKRAERMREYFADEIERAVAIKTAATMVANYDRLCEAAGFMPWPYRNVWLGVSVEDQQRADERIPLLLQTPAAVRFLSCEPLLGPVDLSCVPWPQGWQDDDDISDGIDPLRFVKSRIGWVIVGGESGPGARPSNTDWVQSIVDQCKAAGTACFVKQLGAHVIQGGERRIKRDKKGGDMHEWPHELRVREYPRAKS